jgi:hypothetical protein
MPSRTHIGGVGLTNQAIRVQTKSDEGAFSSEDFNGILGSDLLRQFEVTFDLQHDRLFLQKDPAFKPDPYRYTTVGIQIGKNGAVNDGATIDFPEEVTTRLHAKAGTTIKLRIRRDSQLSIVTLQTRQLLCAGH